MWLLKQPDIVSESSQANKIMKKRIRKKKHLREYREWGVPIAIKRKREDDFDSFLDDFIEGAIEGNKCYFGGGGHKNELEGVIELGRIPEEIELRLKGVHSWLENREDIEKYSIGNHIDLWHGSFKEIDE